ncbi:hypothetical protein NKG94_21640 [Micromonospora sp. M12]
MWASPVDDKALAELIPRIAAFGFDAVELPIEQPGDWDPARTRDLLAEHGLVAAGVCAVLAGAGVGRRRAGRGGVDSRVPRGVRGERGGGRRAVSAARCTPRSAAPGGCQRRLARPATRSSGGPWRRWPSRPASWA